MNEVLMMARENVGKNVSLNVQTNIELCMKLPIIKADSFHIC